MATLLKTISCSFQAISHATINDLEFFLITSL